MTESCWILATRNQTQPSPLKTKVNGSTTEDGERKTGKQRDMLGSLRENWPSPGYQP